MRCYQDSAINYSTDWWKLQDKPCDYRLSSSLNQIEFDELNIFPNPARDKITIYSQSSRILAVEIYDLTGTCLYRNLNVGSNRIDLETDNLPKGMYVVKVRDERDMISRKIVIH